MSEEYVTLSDGELEVVRQATSVQSIPFDPSQRRYSLKDLGDLGIVREYYSASEVREKGFDCKGVLSSFDSTADLGRDMLKVGAPFAQGAAKWQLPIDVPDFRIIFTVFPPGTVVEPHTHSVLDESEKSGGLRIVVRGSIFFEGRRYLPGDWFFIPNGVPYSFSTDPEVETMESYWYGHNIIKAASRFSYPHR